MQTRLRPHKTRGHVVVDPWLNARHTFSFGEYHDPKWVHFSNLRVINQDIVAPGGGFPPHGHRDMEIITYVLRGAIRHRDSMGNEAIVLPGEIQVMGAGTGVEHSEFNDSKSEELELLQIWIFPEAKGLKPFYGQKKLSELPIHNDMRLLVSRDGLHGSVSIRQYADLYAAILDQPKTIKHRCRTPKSSLWMQMVRGQCTVGDQALNAGDGCGFTDCTELSISASAQTEFLLFDLGEA